jgi:ribose transport system substrate-binding protein
MARYTRKLKKATLSSRAPKRKASVKKAVSSAPKKQHTYSPQTTRSTSPVRKPISKVPGRTSYKRPMATQSRFGLWLKVLRALFIRYRARFIIGICALVLIIAAGAFFLIFGKSGKLSFVNADVASESSPGLTEDDDPYAEKYTDEELAGLAGTDLDLTSEEYAGILDEERVFIGVTIGEPTPYEAILIQKLEEAINEEYQNGTVGDCIPYNSNGDINQQIQDVRSLVNKEAKAIIVCATKVDEYTIITDMAKSAGIAVVAVNAPVDYGYDINILADDNDFGNANAIFVGNNVGTGNVVQFVDTSIDAGNKDRLEAFNAKMAEFSKVNILATKNLGEGTSVSTAYDEVKELGTIEAIYTENGYALKVLNEIIKREAFPKVFIGDATAGFIKKWYELSTAGVEIEKKVDPDDRKSETFKKLIEPPSMKVFVRPTPYGVAATAVKFAIRLAEGKDLKTDMLTENKVYYYTGSTAIIDSVLPYYYEMVKDKDDDFVINDWPTDYEVDQYFEGSGHSYYDQTELKLPQPTPEPTPEPSESPEPSASAEADAE